MKNAMKASNPRPLRRRLELLRVGAMAAAAIILLAGVHNAAAQFSGQGAGTLTPSGKDGSTSTAPATKELFTVPMCEVVKWAAGRGYRFSIYREQNDDKVITSYGFTGLVLKNIDFKKFGIEVSQKIGHMECMTPGNKKVRIDNLTKNPSEKIRYFFFIDSNGDAKKLSEGWTFEGVNIGSISDPHTWEVAEKKGTDDPSFAIRVTPLAANDNRVSSSVELETIALRGPKGADWKQAFRHGGLASECIANSDCDSKSCDPAKKRCVPANGTGGLYSFCTKDAQCSNMLCYDNSCLVDLAGTCKANSACKSQRCDYGNGTQNSKKCIPMDGMGKIDDFCNHNNQCANRNCFKGKCAAPKGIGEECGTDAGCVTGMACDNGKKRCTAGGNQAKDGQYCTNTNQCSTSSFCPSPGSTCKAKLGVPKSSLGSDAEYKCTGNDQCKSNFCNHPGTSRCFPAQNTGAAGYFCVNNANCKAGHQCVLQSGKNWGYCN